MREIVLDTETTGLEPSEGHKLIEIGCVEVVNQIPTGKTYHQYINPERDVPAEAVAVHGLTEEMLKKEPVFSQIYADFLDFIGDAQLVIHNAEFDMKFINFELEEVGHKPLSMKRVTDTLKIAREKFPGSPASLDALCRRFDIDNSDRELHGALLDSELLAEVYLELMGGRQHGLVLDINGASSVSDKRKGKNAVAAGRSIVDDGSKNYREPRNYELSEEEKQLHQKMLEEITDPVWLSGSE
jgi:DNA polymerase-3 subunit epsilon